MRVFIYKIIARLTTTTLMLWFSVGCVNVAFAKTDSAGKSQKPKYNVLFIAVDDLRPELGAYGVKDVFSPNMDDVARRGMTFLRNYCQFAQCAQSRSSLLTGRRPDTIRVYDLATHFRLNQPNIVTLPQFFKEHGYYTKSVGKVYHGGLDDPLSWSEPSYVPPLLEFSGEVVAPGIEFAQPENVEFIRQEWLKDKMASKRLKTEPLEVDPKTGAWLKIAYPRYIGGPLVEESPNDAEEILPDGAIANEAVKNLEKLKDKTFFLAVGFRKPHLPFTAPKKYFDLYPPTEKTALPGNIFAPVDVPFVAMSDMRELRFYSDAPMFGFPSDRQTRELIRGYRAAISYADAMVGRVLKKLDELGLREKTIVVVWGDHGFSIGENAQWCKHGNFEMSTRSPLIVSVPGMKNQGSKTDGLTEFVDLYPTLAELANLPKPSGVEGASFAPLMNNPNLKWKTAAFSQYAREHNVMGYAMRTERYRYVEWKDAKGKVVGTELYDHQIDPQENVNLGYRADRKPLITALSKQLNAGWRAALPPRRR